MKMIKALKKFFLFLSFFIIFLSIYIEYNFGNISFEQLLYTIMTSEGTSISAVLGGIIFIVVMIIISYAVIFLFNKIKRKLNISLIL